MNFTKKITMIISAAFLSIKIMAQDDIQRISLSEALDIGIEKRYDARANKINIDLADNATQRSKLEWLPDITGSGTIKDNTKLQTMILSDNVNGTTTITIGATNQTVFALDLTQHIYKPGLNTDIRIAGTEALLEKEKNTEKENSIKQSIAAAYLNVILKENQWKSASSIVKRSTQYYLVAEEKYRLMASLENDYIKSKLDYENVKIAEREASQNYQLALTQLKHQLNFPTSANIVLTDSLATFEQEYTYNSEAGIMERTEVKQLILQNQVNKLKLKKSKQYFMPAVSVIANYSTQIQSESFNYFNQRWSPFSYIGLKLSLPVIGNFRNANMIKENRLKIMQTELQLQQKLLDADNEILKYQTDLVNTQSAIISNRNNLTLSKSLFQNQMNMYKLGTATYSSMLDTESSLNTVDQNYIKAIYNYLMAKINYEISIGKL